MWKRDRRGQETIPRTTLASSACEATANVGWGDDGSTLYITADMYLARVRLNTKGLGF